ncbi:hypothetical protein MTO96_049739 [Rhipicephalus appendiculatus]
MGSDHFPIFTNIIGFGTAGRHFCNVTRWDTYRAALDESSVRLSSFLPAAPLGSAFGKGRNSTWCQKWGFLFCEERCAIFVNQRFVRR